MAERLFLSRPSTLTPGADGMDVDVDDPRPATPSRGGTEYHTPPPRSPPPARCDTVSDVEEEVRNGTASKEPGEPNKPTTTNQNQSQNETQDQQPQSQTRPEESHTHNQHTTHEIDTFDIFEPQQALPLIHHRKARKQRQRGGWFEDSHGRHDDENEDRMGRENARPYHFDAPRYHDEERYDEHERDRHHEHIEERNLDDRRYLERGDRDRDRLRNEKELRREERRPEERGKAAYGRGLEPQYSRQDHDRPREDLRRDERQEREKRHEPRQQFQERQRHPQSARDDRERREAGAPTVRLPDARRLEPGVDRQQPARRDDRRGIHNEGRRDVRLEDPRRDDQHRGEQRRDSHRRRDDTYRDRDPQRREASRDGREARRDTRRDPRVGCAAGDTSRARPRPSSSAGPSRPPANRAPSRAPKRPADSDSDIEYMGCNKKTRPGVDATKAIKTEPRDDVQTVREERRTETQAPQAPPAPRSDSGELREIEPGERGGGGAGARVCGECGCECRQARREPGRGRGSTVLSLQERRNLLSVLLGTPAAARPTNPLSHIRRVHPNLQSWGEVTRYIGVAPGNEERVRQTAGDMMREVPYWVRK